MNKIDGFWPVKSLVLNWWKFGFQTNMAQLSEQNPLFGIKPSEQTHPQVAMFPMDFPLLGIPYQFRDTCPKKSGTSAALPRSKEC